MNIFSKGDFQSVSDEQIRDYQRLADLMEEMETKYNYSDSDSFMDNCRDANVGRLLGYTKVNNSKHGFDCSTDDQTEFLEVKKVNSSTKNWKATFNDTSIEKALSFKEHNVNIAVPIYKNSSTILFIAYGRDDSISDYLCTRVRNRKPGSRSTQSIDVTKLISKYGFKIRPITSTKEEILDTLKSKYPKFDLNCVEFF